MIFSGMPSECRRVEVCAPPQFVKSGYAYESGEAGVKHTTRFVPATQGGLPNWEEPLLLFQLRKDLSPIELQGHDSRERGSTNCHTLISLSSAGLMRKMILRIRSPQNTLFLASLPRFSMSLFAICRQS